jgi:hypothetical protein
MKRFVLLMTAALLLVGCHSKARIFLDGGGYQKLRKEERAEEAERERLEWTRTCRALFVERRQLLDAAIARVEEGSPQGDAALKAFRQEWKKDTDPLVRGIPQQANDEPQRQDRVAFETHYHAERARVRRLLIQKAVEGRAPRQGRTILFSAYNRDLNTKDAELEGFAQQIAEQYNADLLERFTRFGGYGKLGVTQDKVSCVFSESPWPDDVSAIEPRFTTHFTGREVPVYVLCRLPLPAKRYARPGAAFVVQLLSDAHGQVDVAASYDLGPPESVGDAPYLRTAFELPPNARFDHSRFFFDVRVLLVWNTGGGQRRQVLAQSSFTWQATD